MKFTIKDKLSRSQNKESKQQTVDDIVTTGNDWKNEKFNGDTALDSLSVSSSGEMSHSEFKDLVLNELDSIVYTARTEESISRNINSFLEHINKENSEMLKDLFSSTAFVDKLLEFLDYRSIRCLLSRHPVFADGNSRNNDLILSELVDFTYISKDSINLLAKRFPEEFIVDVSDVYLESIDFPNLFNYLYGSAILPEFYLKVMERDIYTGIKFIPKNKDEQTLQYMPKYIGEIKKYLHSSLAVNNISSVKKKDIQLLSDLLYERNFLLEWAKSNGRTSSLKPDKDWYVKLEDIQDIIMMWCTLSVWGGYWARWQERIAEILSETDHLNLFKNFKNDWWEWRYIIDFRDYYKKFNKIGLKFINTCDPAKLPDVMMELPKSMKDKELSLLALDKNIESILHIQERFIKDEHLETLVKKKKFATLFQLYWEKWISLSDTILEKIVNKWIMFHKNDNIYEYLRIALDIKKNKLDKNSTEYKNYHTYKNSAKASQKLNEMIANEILIDLIKEHGTTQKFLRSQKYINIIYSIENKFDLKNFLIVTLSNVNLADDRTPYEMLDEVLINYSNDHKYKLESAILAISVEEWEQIFFPYFISRKFELTADTLKTLESLSREFPFMQKWIEQAYLKSEKIVGKLNCPLNSQDDLKSTIMEVCNQLDNNDSIWYLSKYYILQGIVRHFYNNLSKIKETDREINPFNYIETALSISQKSVILDTFIDYIRNVNSAQFILKDEFKGIFDKIKTWENTTQIFEIIAEINKYTTWWVELTTYEYIKWLKTLRKEINNYL